ncbi:MAG: thiamine phosphate synthase [Rhodobacteraceae bacterium]|nr:thiamine phosphate synthase [Paracoccaceae bacterium]MCB2142359.1 thiamine phosphate synthase [Paracoccaceae bacterium]
MPDTDRPQLCLITPAEIDLDTFCDALSAVLDAVDTACLRLSLATRDEDRIARAADAVRLVAHDRDIPVVIESHVQIAERHGLDGVHLTDGARSVRTARKVLGTDAIVGAYCGQTRHEGINAGEAGADYVAFGPVGSVALGPGERADRDLFDWWSAMIEVPVIAEGGLTAELVESFAPVADFFAIGTEIWGADDPAAALKALMAPIL